MNGDSLVFIYVKNCHCQGSSDLNCIFPILQPTTKTSNGSRLPASSTILSQFLVIRVLVSRYLQSC